MHPSLASSLLALSLAQEPSITAILGSDPYGGRPVPTVAPGELATIIVRGWNKTVLKPILPPPGDLPLELGGVKVRIESPIGGDPKFVPILRIDQSQCGYRCDTHAITVLMPMNLAMQRPQLLATVIVDDAPGITTEFKAVANNLTLLNECHVALRVPNSPCEPLVYHEDGTLVRRDSPARPRELILIRALGLERMDNYSFQAKTVTLGFNNLLLDTDAEARSVEFATLTPQVGIYQLGIRLPDQMNPEAPNCQLGVGPPVRSANTRILVAPLSVGGFDNARSVDICVQP